MKHDCYLNLLEKWGIENKMLLNIYCNVKVAMMFPLPAFRNSSARRPKLAKPYSALLNPPLHQSE